MEQSNSETKVFADNKMRVLWNAGDLLTVFNQSTYNSKFEFAGEDGDNAGDFDDVTPSGLHSGNALSNIYAVYPYAKGNKINNDGNTITLTLPAEQQYKEHSFGIGANAMVAVTDNDFLAFKNLGGYLQLRLYGDNVKVSSIKIQGNNGEKIAGKANVAVGLGVLPTVTMDDTATDAITLVCDPPVALGATAEQYTDFWFVLPPTTFSGGFTITVIDEMGGIFQKTTTNSLTIARSTIEYMKTLQVIPNYDNDFVEFEDATFKTYCLDKFDTNHDGNISIIEARDVEQIDIYCGYGKSIESLKGIECFINLKSLRCGWNNLTSLDVSHNTALTYLGCEDNNLTSLDVSHNTALLKIECFSNQLKRLDVSKNTSLTYLTCGWNQLTVIDVSHNTELNTFGCDRNQLINVDVSHNTALTTFICYGNQLTSLDVSHNTALQELVCFSTLLTNLDVSYNTDLTRLDCHDNPELSEIWLMNGQIIQDINYDPNITTIHYKGGDQNIVFADRNVKSICVSHWDTNGDGELSYSEAEAVTDIKDYFSKNTKIFTFDEIRYFTNVNSFADSAFYGCEKLVEFNIPDQIITIGNVAFYGCNALQNIRFGSGVTTIGTKILHQEYLRTLTVSEYNKKYDSRNNCTALVETSTNTILYGCRNSTIPEGIESIATEAFWGAGLINFTLPSTIRTIGVSAFSGYNEFKHINCLAPTPPTLIMDSYFTVWHPFLSGLVWSYETTIYVPSTKFEAYSEAWGSLRSVTINCIE